MADDGLIDELASRVASLEAQLSGVREELAEAQQKLHAPDTGDDSLRGVLDQFNERLNRLFEGADKTIREGEEVGKLRHEVDELFRRRRAADDAASSSGGLRRFKLTNPTGNHGNRSTEPAIKYDVRDPTSNQLLGSSIALTGHGQRIVNATIGTDGTHAIGEMNGGTPLILWADERYSQSQCTPTGQTQAQAFFYGR